MILVTGAGAMKADELKAGEQKAKQKHGVPA